MKKYKYTGETIIWHNHELHRIIALRDFGDIKKGDVGGWIQRHCNLSHEGDCWVYCGSRVYGNAKVRDNAKVKGSSSVFNFAQVFDNAIVDHSHVYGNAWIFENAKVMNGSTVCKDTMVYGNAKINEGQLETGHHSY